MSLISLCMIVKNEEDVLERCLVSVKDLVDEIIIVDTGSTDKTKQIAKKFTNKIFDFEWCDDFSLARNYAFSLANFEYIMWLDADDVITKDSLNKLLKLKENLTKDVYMLKYDIAFRGSKPTFSYYRERILKRCDKCKWVGVVHESIAPFGEIERVDISIEHRKIKSGTSDRNLKIYQNLSKKRSLEPREMYYYARELFDHKEYEKCIITMQDFISSNGWVENIIDGLYIKARAHLYLNQEKESFNCLISTFLYDKPRANIVCMIGDYFIGCKEYDKAIYWYEVALNAEDVTYKGGFVENQYYNYYPYLQLCVCYHRLNDNIKAKYYNEKAGEYFLSESVINNRKYFNSIGV